MQKREKECVLVGVLEDYEYSRGAKIGLWCACRRR